MSRRAPAFLVTVARSSVLSAFNAGINWAGVTALVTGTVVAAQCVATPLYTGPIARAAGGMDLSLPAGILVSAAVYLTMMRR